MIIRDLAVAGIDSSEVDPTRGEAALPSSDRLARRHAKARQKELTVRGVAQLRGARHQMTSKDAQPSNDLPRFIEPPHLGVACRENTV